MSDADPSTALARIERAIARIEAAAGTPPPRAGLAEAYAMLDERHDRLRLRVQETIERLDGLIDGGPLGASPA